MGPDSVGSPRDAQWMDVKYQALTLLTDPVNGIDPSGQQDLVSIEVSTAIESTLGQAEAIVGTSIMNQLAYGGNAGIKNLLITAGIVIGGMILFKAVGGAIEYISALSEASAAEELAQFEYASDYGILPVKDLNKIKAVDANWPADAQIHHLIEERLAPALNVDPDDIPGIVLKRGEEHQRFTNAWRDAIHYSNSAPPNTVTATPDEIWAAAQEVYEDYPTMLEYCGKFLGR